ncbi:MAG: methionyl-tRNA formyltransferase [Defluviitaleaceae bacterium]|nr:methionyl-tRNA formyltransferase [Defluviitaleaceae bacterium]
MKIIFMGTPVFAAASLEALMDKHEVVAVCTQPDRPAGRGHRVTASPVKEFALQRGLPVFQPETLRLSESREVREELAAFGADIFVVAAYGLLLPKGVLEMPRFGCVNVHASLLPKYRGASPIHAAILNGDRETGITIMHMDAGLDTGDMILQKRLEVGESERFAELHDRMATLGAEALLEALEQIEAGTAARVPQNHALASHAPLLKKSDGLINWADTSEKIFNRVRALACFTMYGGDALKIWGVEKIEDCEELQKLQPGRVSENPVEPCLHRKEPTASGRFLRCGKCETELFEHSAGRVLAADSKVGLIVATGDGALRVTELQAVGKKRMAATDYLRGQKIGEFLG